MKAFGEGKRSTTIMLDRQSLEGLREVQAERLRRGEPASLSAAMRQLFREGFERRQKARAKEARQ